MKTDYERLKKLVEKIKGKALNGPKMKRQLTKLNKNYGIY